MKSNVPLAQASTEEAVLPERIQEALGQLVGAAKEGLLALSVGVGLGVLAELLEVRLRSASAKPPAPAPSVPPGGLRIRRPRR